ncbi:MAG: hypothetical protein P8144_14865, partial [Gammaproteobacteria bacterium]
MVEVANVVEIKSVVNQLMNPHRPHLQRESGDPRSWGRFLRQLGQSDHSHRLIQWVCTHPIYLIDVQGGVFRKKPVALVELLQRENLVRQDFIRSWMRFEASPRRSLLKHVELQRHALQIASMMWFSPAIAVSYDYQELFQSLCEFLQIVRELIEASCGVSLISERLVERVSDRLWREPLSLPRVARRKPMQHEQVASENTTPYLPTVEDLMDSGERFQRLIGRSMRLRVGVHAEGQAQRVDSWQNENVALDYWYRQMFDDVQAVIREWYSSVNCEDTRLGARPVQEIYG